MFKIFLLFTSLLIPQIVLSQKNPLDKLDFNWSYLDYDGCVEKIAVKQEVFRIRKNKPDTTTLFTKVHFNEKNQITSKLNYRYSFEDEEPYKLVNYDSLSRPIFSIGRFVDGRIKRVEQFYTRDNILPDSSNTYDKLNSKYEQIKFYFKGNLVVKREYYKLDTLRKFATYKYDSLSRLIKEVNVNTKNGSLISIGKSITGGVVEKKYRPNDSIAYRYSNIGDTLITEMLRNNKLWKREKVVSIADGSLEIVEKFSFGRLWDIKTNYKWKDSSKYFKRRFNENAELDGYTYNATYKDKFIKEYVLNITRSSNEILETMDITTLYDHKNNWIKKTYSIGNKVEKIITRKINYYCD